MVKLKKYKIKDSGKRRKWPTGANRDVVENKGRCDLLPPLALLKLALHFQKGAKKYEARNWEKGIPVSAFSDSMLRHFFKWMANILDGEDHLIAALWNLICLVETKIRIDKGILPKSLDDMPLLTVKYYIRKEKTYENRKKKYRLAITVENPKEKNRKNP